MVWVWVYGFMDYGAKNKRIEWRQNHILFFHFHGQFVFAVRILRSPLLGIQEIIVLNKTIVLVLNTFNRKLLKKTESLLSSIENSLFNCFHSLKRTSIFNAIAWVWIFYQDTSMFCITVYKCIQCYSVSQDPVSVWHGSLPLGPLCNKDQTPPPQHLSSPANQLLFWSCIITQTRTPSF